MGWEEQLKTDRQRYNLKQLIEHLDKDECVTTSKTIAESNAEIKNGVQIGFDNKKFRHHSKAKFDLIVSEVHCALRNHLPDLAFDEKREVKRTKVREHDGS